MRLLEVAVSTMSTPSSSARLLKAKLYRSPARKRVAVVKRCSPKSRKNTPLDVRSLLSMTPRSTKSNFSVKKLLEVTPRTSRHHSSCSKNTKAILQEVATRRSLFHLQPDAKDDVSMELDAHVHTDGADREHDSVGGAGENRELIPMLEASVKERFPMLKSKLICLDESSEVEGGKCWLEVLSQSVIVHHTLGPFNCARVFVSDLGVYQLQALFPIARTVLTGNNVITVPITL